MLTDPKLRSQVDALWDKFWTGGLANLYEPPLDMLAADAGGSWFSKNGITEVLTFGNQLVI